MFRYFIANKPYDTICQFTPEVEGQKTLADLDFSFPKDVYPIGRLDLDSEGLLLLTNDRKLNHTLLNPQFAHERTYLAQVETENNQITDAAIRMIHEGVEIKIEKKIYQTLPAKARRVETPSLFFDGKDVWERIPPAKPQGGRTMNWLEITLIEGKNRQVRRMCAKILHPCLRLIRVKIGDLSIGDLPKNAVLELEQDFIYQKLGLSPQ